MLDVVKDILCEHGFEYIKEVEFSHIEQKYGVSILQNTEIISQVYLLIPIEESKFLEIDMRDDFIPEVVGAFKDSGVYATDMDKNTSLIFCVERDVFSKKLNSHMVEIEDDPYYFKKYVFYYSKNEEVEFRALKKQYNKTTVELIQSYIFDKTNFDKFKSNSNNEDMYRLISDIFIKIPIIPVSFDTEEAKIKSVGSYMKDTRTYQDYSINKLDMIVNHLLDDEEESLIEKVDKLISTWNEGVLG